MMDGVRLRLHLGAHKTASTHLNEMVQKNARMFERAGVTAFHKEELRRPLERTMWDAERGYPERVEWVETRARLSTKTQVLLSDENILGLPPEAGPSGGLYPSAPDRVTLALRLLGAVPARTELMIAIRNPVGLFPSAWCEAVRDRDTPPFNRWLGAARLGQPYWSRFFERLTDALPDYPLTVWTYERYLGDPSAIISHLMGLCADARPALEQVDGVIRPGPSARAIERILARRAEDPALARSDVDQIVADLPRGPDRPGPDPFSLPEKEILNAAYAADLETISRMPNVTFLG